MSGRKVECFWIEPTGMVRQKLRRYQLSRDLHCPGEYSYHNAEALFQLVPMPEGVIPVYPHYDLPPRDDSRWPVKCDHCDYVFTVDDNWDVSQSREYHRPGQTETFSTWDSPVGSIWDAAGIPEKHVGPDGKCLCIKTPGGVWMPDMSSENGPPWTRTGTIPALTIRPSILIYGLRGQPNYHAFMTDGVLVDC